MEHVLSKSSKKEWVGLVSGFGYGYGSSVVVVVLGGCRSSILFVEIERVVVVVVCMREVEEE